MSKWMRRWGGAGALAGLLALAGCAGQGAGSAAGQDAGASGPRAIAKEAYLYAVSYTHLTLPTKRIV